ncbi:MAG: HAD family phosphatase [Deltaproteobacteria bacterium]|nr:HAD family phosphatase [Deltaproteobacteria bacterium]
MIRLLALDLDGTLLRRDGSVAPQDVLAIDRARREGLAVTLATGRIAGGTRPTAQALGLDTPYVCSDGALLVDPLTDRVLEHRPLGEQLVREVTEALTLRGLLPVWFTLDDVHGETGAEALSPVLSIWSPRVHFHATLAALAVDHGAVTFALGVGAEGPVQDARDALFERHGERAEVLAFQWSRQTTWTVLVRARGVDKASGLAALARRVGLGAHEIAVCGDWFNDVPMFRWAGRSFAMGQSPEAVASEATDRLQATHHTGGGVAEALARLLGW